MATTSRMIQSLVEQVADSTLTQVYPLEEEAYLFLDPTKRTVLRELAAEEYGGILGGKLSGPLNISFTDRAFARLRLVFARRERSEDFYGPSHVPSPEISGAGLAVLQVFEAGASVTSGGTLVVYRAIGAHAYIDQID
jgi:hypothetical protein